MQVNPQKIQQIYDFLVIQDKDLRPADGVFVFCRADPLIAKRVSELFKSNLIGYAMLTGGIGKDSGDLAESGTPESVYQENQLHDLGIYSNLYIEKNAKNGIQNSELGIQKILANNLKHDNLIMVIHPTQSRRIYAVHQIIAKKTGFKANYQLTTTDYKFDSNNLVDQKEAISELQRLKEYSDTNQCTPQNIPPDLLEYAKQSDLGVNWGC